MGKQSGLGDHFLIGGYLVGDDVTDVALSGGPTPGDVTGITKSAHERIGLLRDGSIDVTVVTNPASGQEHSAFSGLTRNDVIATYLRGQAIGNPAANCVARQVNYDGTRASDGMLTFKVAGQGDGFGLEWGVQLTAGPRTDTTATNGAALDNAASVAWGAQAYLQAVSITGTSTTVTIQHSPDNSTWITLVAFTAVSAPPAAQRVATFTGPFTATNASPAVFTAAGSSFANGTPLALFASTNPGQAIPTGFTAGTTYYVVNASGATFQLAATSGGTAINSSSTGAGTVTQVVQRYLRAITSGTFSSFKFATDIAINPIAGVAF